MSTEVASQAAAPKTPMVAGGIVRPIVPQDFDGAWRIAQAVVRAGMAPYGLDTAEKATIAIMHGMEVGMPPMAALQSIAVVNGRPTIWGDGALALVLASGKCEAFEEFSEGKGDAYTAVCQVKRAGARQPIVRTFSVAQAKASGLWTKRGKNGSPTPWQLYPERMLQMRARAYALRDGFADVLRGLGIAEEVQDTEREGEPAVSRPRTAEIERPALSPADFGSDEEVQTAEPASVERPSDLRPSASQAVERTADTPSTGSDAVQKPAMDASAAPDPDAWSGGEFDDGSEDFDKQADQICDALEAATDRAALEALADQWSDRVAAMPKPIKARCVSVLKACRQKFTGG